MTRRAANTRLAASWALRRTRANHEGVAAHDCSPKIEHVLLRSKQHGRSWWVLPCSTHRHRLPCSWCSGPSRNASVYGKSYTGDSHFTSTLDPRSVARRAEGSAIRHSALPKRGGLRLRLTRPPNRSLELIKAAGWVSLRSTHPTRCRHCRRAKFQPVMILLQPSQKQSPRLLTSTPPHHGHANALVGWRSDAIATQQQEVVA